MSKQRNSNIGYCTCGECGEIAAVRRNRGGKLYYDCLDCGRITPNHEAGQDRVLNRAVIWGEQGMPPPECPKWIAEQWPYTRSLRDPSGRAPIGPINGESPVNEETPEKSTASDAAQSMISPEARPRHRPKIPDPPEKPTSEQSTIPDPEPEPSGFDFLE